MRDCVLRDILRWCCEKLAPHVFDENELKMRLNDVYDQGYNDGYAKCLRDHNLQQAPKVISSPHKSHEESEVAILFVKANRGCDLVNDLKNSMQLSSDIAENLYEVTQKIWVGTRQNLNKSKILDLFNKVGCVSSIGPEYDSYAVQIKLNHPCSDKLSDSFYRHQFIKSICESNSICEKISERLPLTELQKFNLIDM